MELTDILKLLSGPLIGAAIGYFTNMIAVKMLFYPKREIRVFGRRLPLTPGVIPKGRPRLAASVGHVIAHYLLTGEDIAGHLLTKKVENRVTDAVMEKLSGKLKEEIMDFTGLDDAGYQQKKAALSMALSELIVSSLQSSGASETVVAALSETIKEKVSYSPLKLLINDRTLQTFMQPTKEMLDSLISERGAERLAPLIDAKLEEAGGQTGVELLAGLHVDEPALRNAVSAAYRKLVSESVDSILQSVNIASLVEEKINAMPIDELERLIYDVMKKELNAIINLGALIGFILGLLNLFI